MQAVDINVTVITLQILENERSVVAKIMWLAVAASIFRHCLPLSHMECTDRLPLPSFQECYAEVSNIFGAANIELENSFVKFNFHLGVQKRRLSWRKKNIKKTEEIEFPKIKIKRST